ncbi:hypothetical protein BCR34DRAFT_54540 [Clohesyomyces aquaticus]|uniref:DUF7580 domain-containing protein n=1 Tax=Clohesyomyces aquaticus TaxID=1231657 RepID=A0A1Y1Z3I1_9PLEO|nr:hypothetical protein BCR34DRAFT_54540 [Clohesyomyces aquaticus]
MDRIFANVRSTSTLSLASRRRLWLLQAILPSVSQAAAQIYHTCRPFSSAKVFWTKFLTSCLLMDSGGWRFDRLDNRHEDLLIRSLRGLERVIDLELPQIPEAYTSAPFPRLETLREHIKKSTSDEDDSSFSSIVKLIKPENVEFCREVIDALKELADAMEDTSQQPAPVEAPVASRWKPVLAPVLLDLLSVLSKSFQHCQCVRPHKAILLLFTHRVAPDEGLHSFKLLFAKGAAGYRWKEAIVIVKEHMPEPQVRMVLPNTSDQIGDRVSEPVLIKNICDSIDDAAPAPLNLRIERGALYQQGLSATLATKGPTEGIPMSLSDGLLGNETELGINGQLCLAVVLSYSLLDFCGEPWFPDGWTRNGIHLLQHDQQLSLRPTLVAAIRPKKLSAEVYNVPIDIKLLFHGILLMEIFRQEPLPIDLSVVKTMGVAELRELALHQFEAMSTQWGVCERYRQSVEACIEGIEAQDVWGGEESFARVFIQKVISPLETDYVSLWGNRDPDELIAELKLPSVKRKKPPLPGPKPAHFQSFKPTSGATIGNSRLPLPPLKLFDSVGGIEPKQ